MNKRVLIYILLFSFSVCVTSGDSSGATVGTAVNTGASTTSSAFDQQRSDFIAGVDQAGTDIANAFTSAYDSVSSFFSQAWDTIASDDTVQTIGEMVGVVSEHYYYNYAIWNDSNETIYSGQQTQTSFMGATFTNTTTGIVNAATISSWLNPSAGDSWTNDSTGLTINADVSAWKDKNCTYTVVGQRLYFDLYINLTSDITTDPLYMDPIETLAEKDSTKVYHYRAYNARKWSNGVESHSTEIENLGYSDIPQTSSDDDDDDSTQSNPSVVISNQLSSIVFFNNSNDDIQVSFTHNGKQITVSVENNSFGLFSAGSDDDSLRPNTFTFYDFGSTTSFATVDFSEVGHDGKTYTMEIYQDSGMSSKAVGLQAISMGCYDIPVSSRVRDVVPVPCNFWWKSVAEMQTSDDTDTSNYLNLPGQVWIVYDSPDTPIMSKVDVGDVVSWNLARPRISQGSNYVYFLYIETTSDSTAQNFIADFLYGDIGTDVKGAYQDSSSQQLATESANALVTLSTSSSSSQSDTSSDSSIIDQEIQAITGTLDSNVGVMTDDAGTVGYLIGADYFGSQGLGNSEQNYVLAPSMYNLKALQNACAMYLTDTTSVLSWMVNYTSQKDSTTSSVQAALVAEANPTYVNDDGTLTDAGTMALNAILTGPISLQNPSLYISTSSNYTTTGTSVGTMPDAQALSTTPMPTYTAPVTAAG